VSSQWLTWWFVLCAATVINVIAWRLSERLLTRGKAYLNTDIYAVRRRLLWLSAVYVIGCGFRSVLPMVDVPRICLHDTWLSRIVVGRSVATVAELAFAAQWALLLREAGAAAGSGFVIGVSRLLVPIIIIAELACWFAVLTTNYLSHAIENSLWTLEAVLVVLSFASARPHLDEKSRYVVDAAIVCGTVYVAFMGSVDVPMYLSRWHAGLAAGHEYLSLREGMIEVLQPCIVTRDWTAWRDDVLWLSLYFTVGVWVSIGLAHAPEFRRLV
jgi:hypothetical protein